MAVIAIRALSCLRLCSRRPNTPAQSRPLPLALSLTCSRAHTHLEDLPTDRRKAFTMKNSEEEVRQSDIQNNDYVKWITWVWSGRWLLVSFRTHAILAKREVGFPCLHFWRWPPFATTFGGILRDSWYKCYEKENRNEIQCSRFLQRSLPVPYRLGTIWPCDEE